MLFLMRVSLLSWRTHQNHIKKIWLYKRLCYTYYIHIQKKNGDIITLTQFEEGDLPPETCDNTESSDESDID